MQRTRTHGSWAAGWRPPYPKPPMPLGNIYPSRDEMTHRPRSEPHTPPGTQGHRQCRPPAAGPAASCSRCPPSTCSQQAHTTRQRAHAASRLGSTQRHESRAALTQHDSRAAGMGHHKLHQHHKQPHWATISCRSPLVGQGRGQATTGHDVGGTSRRPKETEADQHALGRLLCHLVHGAAPPTLHHPHQATLYRVYHTRQLARRPHPPKRDSDCCPPALQPLQCMCLPLPPTCCSSKLPLHGAAHAAANLICVSGGLALRSNCRCQPSLPWHTHPTQLQQEPPSSRQLCTLAGLH